MLTSLEEHDIETPGVQRQPGRVPEQEKARQGSQRPDPGTIQEQPPPPALGSGEQPSPGTHTRQEEEETPQQEALYGEFNMLDLYHTWLLLMVTVPE